jgi:hypothetical protein
MTSSMERVMANFVTSSPYKPVEAHQLTDKSIGWHIRLYASRGLRAHCMRVPEKRPNIDH